MNHPDYNSSAALKQILDSKGFSKIQVNLNNLEYNDCGDQKIESVISELRVYHLKEKGMLNDPSISGGSFLDNWVSCFETSRMHSYISLNEKHNDSFYHCDYSDGFYGYSDGEIDYVFARINYVLGKAKLELIEKELKTAPLYKKAELLKAKYDTIFGNMYLEEEFLGVKSIKAFDRDSKVECEEFYNRTENLFDSIFEEEMEYRLVESFKSPNEFSYDDILYIKACSSFLSTKSKIDLCVELSDFNLTNSKKDVFSDMLLYFDDASVLDKTRKASNEIVEFIELNRDLFEDGRVYENEAFTHEYFDSRLDILGTDDLLLLSDRISRIEGIGERTLKTINGIININTEKNYVKSKEM